jgi:ferritin-like metal-binding protein YciE
MSGGSMNYLSTRVEMAEFTRDSVLRRAFYTHLQKVAATLHAIEWVDSGDSGPGDDETAIRACLSEGAELSQAIADAEHARAELVAAIMRAEAAR